MELSAQSQVRLAPGATRDIVLIVALKSPEAELTALQRFVAALAPSRSGDWFRRAWTGVLAPLAKAPDPALRAELQWNGHALLAMATYAAYYRETFIPQGMTYFPPAGAGSANSSTTCMLVITKSSLTTKPVPIIVRPASSLMSIRPTCGRMCSTSER